MTTFRYINFVVYPLSTFIICCPLVYNSITGELCSFLIRGLVSLRGILTGHCSYESDISSLWLFKKYPFNFEAKGENMLNMAGNKVE